MRTLHKAWQNKRPGWTRRIRYYKGTDDIRLEVHERPVGQEDRDHFNATFTDKADAERWYENYIAGNTGRNWWFGIKQEQEEE